LTFFNSCGLKKTKIRKGLPRRGLEFQIFKQSKSFKEDKVFYY